MAESPSSWGDTSTWLGAGGLVGILGAIAKAYADWRKDRRDSEGEVRDDLRAELTRQGVVIERLQQELAEERIRARVAQDAYNVQIAAMQDRIFELQSSLAASRGEIAGLRAQLELQSR